MRSLDWMSEALCKGMHADFWFPPMEEANQSPYYRIGKSLCHHCPVWQECLQYAQTNNEVWGCWGGLTPQERNRPYKVSHGTVEKKRLGALVRRVSRQGLSHLVHPLVWYPVWVKYTIYKI